jgi:hypothetical protein
MQATRDPESSCRNQKGSSASALRAPPVRSTGPRSPRPHQQEQQEEEAASVAKIHAQAAVEGHRHLWAHLQAVEAVLQARGQAVEAAHLPLEYPKGPARHKAMPWQPLQPPGRMVQLL